ncbi:hypothetical protein TURU_147124 [Turdus rufiventris]|nr:hypothetical protein TURU_147124 [Turdus rufiventris]
MDYCALNEVTPPLSPALLDMLELQYELESKTAKWYTTSDLATAFFSIPLAAECRPQFTFTWRAVQYTWNRLSQGCKHIPTICHGLIQAALEKGEAPEHLQYIDGIIVRGKTAMEVFEKGKRIIQILLSHPFLSGPSRHYPVLPELAPEHPLQLCENHCTCPAQQEPAAPLLAVTGTAPKRKYPQPEGPSSCSVCY